MASYSDWCEEQLSKLQNEESRVPILQEMKNFLTTMPCEEITRTAPYLSLPPVFDCLNDTNNEQIDLACEVLSICMTNLSIGESTNRYGVFLERALNHPHPGVKLMALTEIHRNFENDDVLVDLCKRDSLLINIVRCFSDSDLSVAKKSADIVKIVGMSTFGIKQITRPDIVKAFEEMCTIDEIIRFRIYEVLVELSVQSETNFEIIQGTPFLIKMILELTNNDVLLLLNVLELLTKIASSKYGFIYLEKNQVIYKVVKMLDNNDALFQQLAEPGILTFLGHIANANPLKTLQEYPTFYKRLITNLEGQDFTIIGVSLNTLGHIGSSIEGKIAFESIGSQIENALRLIGKKMSSYPTEIKIRTLGFIENLIRIPNNAFNVQVSQLTRKWFCLLDSSPIDLIWNYARNPFYELRLSGLAVFNAIIGYNWGRDLVRNSPGLIEFLLDRSVETNKDCVLAKYDIIKLLAKEDGIFSENITKKLRNYVKEGAFYMQAQLDVAIDGNE